jgi:SAM-dependent methyltransferase
VAVFCNHDGVRLGPGGTPATASDDERAPALRTRQTLHSRLMALVSRFGSRLHTLAEWPRHSGPSVVWLGGTPLVIVPGVRDPTRSLGRRLLREILLSGAVPPGSAVLDLGCGCGALTVEAARWARRVAAVDLSPEAVRCTRINVLLNRCDDRVVVRQGDLFEPVTGNRFDVVICKLPRSRPGGAVAQGTPDLVARFALGLQAFLTSGGVAFLALSSGPEEAAGLAVLEHVGLLCMPERRGSTLRTFVTVYRCTRAARP